MAPISQLLYRICY